MRGFPVGLALPSARADTGGIRGGQLGKMGISGAHAPVGTAGSAKAKAGFELGGGLLQLVPMFLPLLLCSRTLSLTGFLLHTPHFRHPGLALKHSWEWPIWTPKFLSASFLLFMSMFYPALHAP